MVPAATAGAGALLGYTGTRQLIQQRKKKDRTTELADAQRDYEDAMFSQYDRSRLKAATAAEESATPALDRLFDGLEKSALISEYYMPYAAASGGLMAVAAYLMHRRDTQKMLQDALRRRAGERAALQPPGIALTTQPVPVADEEDDEKPPRQRSSWGF